MLVANCAPHKKHTDLCGLFGFLFVAKLVFGVGVLRRFCEIISSDGTRSAGFFGGTRFLFNCCSGISSSDSFDGGLDVDGSVCGLFFPIDFEMLSISCTSDDVLSRPVVEPVPAKSGVFDRLNLFESIDVSRCNRTVHGIT